MMEDSRPVLSISSHLISVVIPAFSRKTELLRCIGSILESTYKNFEIIVVNNSGQQEFVDAVRAQYPMVKTIELLRNTGIFGVNVGIANALGEYVLVIDDDCGLRTDTLDQIVETFAACPSDVGAIQASIYNPLINQWCMQSPSEQPNPRLCSIAEGSTVFKAEVFKTAGYYDDDFFCWQHGPDLSLRMLGAGYGIRFGNKIVIDHYEKRAAFRPFRAFYESRNMAWLNIKNFSVIFFPLLFARNIGSLCAILFRQKSILAGLSGLVGYAVGWLTFIKPLRKRRIPSAEIQWEFVRFFVFNKFPSSL